MISSKKIIVIIISAVFLIILPAWIIPDSHGKIFKAWQILSETQIKPSVKEKYKQINEKLPNSTSNLTSENKPGLIIKNANVTIPINEETGSRIMSQNSTELGNLKVGEQNSSNILTESLTKQSLNGTLKRILYWTTFWGTPVSDISHETLMDWKCDVSTCEVTTNRSLLTSSDAVLFHIIDTSRDNLPPIRNPLQPWILYILESPAYYQQPTSWNNFFNWTMSYRLDSDVFAPYGEFKAMKVKKPNLRINYAANKTNRAVWFVSHCQTLSLREAYVKELKNYYPVDIYGACGSLKCPRSRESECLKESASRYKYYLSFENSLCTDYATEKVFNPLTKNILPIVFGGANYSALVPPNSVINVFDFHSVKELANYLRYLDQNDFLYNAYFEWKNEYTVESSFHSNYCNLCKKLHEHNGSSKVHTDLKDWWVNKGNCTDGKNIFKI